MIAFGRPRRRRLLTARLVVAIVAAVLATGCSTALRQFPDRAPLKVDPDKQPFGPKPEVYFSGLIADGLDQSLLRPIANLFAVDPGREAVNVNSLDEVPDSSWYTNRTWPMSIEDFVQGPCKGKPPLDDSAGKWIVTGAKPNGENPGFPIKLKDGRRFMLKFDGKKQQPRATAADVVVSRMYYAAGYSTPCNRVVYFDRKVLEISPKAKNNGKPVTDKDLDLIFSKATRLEDGRYRANASLFLPGKPLGPWRYEGTRDDDANDVVNHEDRREIRAAAVMASWTNHFDSREQNTLDMWMEVGNGRGYVQHHYIDFGDCFGSLWEWDELSRRWGLTYLLDPGHVLGDLLTFGFLVRPWDKGKYGKSGDVFAYYGREPFIPDAWYNEYPNPAFSRMTERDAAWMARVIARMSDAHLKAVIKEASFRNAMLDQELFEILKYRRDKLLKRWFDKLAPLADPVVKNAAADGGAAQVCVHDLAVNIGVAKPRRYSSAAWTGLEVKPTPQPRVQSTPEGRVCVTLPENQPASEQAPSYVIVDVAPQVEPKRFTGPLRMHLYQLGPGKFRLAGIERPSHHKAPGE